MIGLCYQPYCGSPGSSSPDNKCDNPPCQQVLYDYHDYDDDDNDHDADNDDHD